MGTWGFKGSEHLFQALEKARLASLELKKRLGQGVAEPCLRSR